MLRETGSDILRRHMPGLQSQNAGYGNAFGVNPNPFVASDGAIFSNEALRRAHELDIAARQMGERTFQISERRLYQRPGLGK